MSETKVIAASQWSQSYAFGLVGMGKGQRQRWLGTMKYISYNYVQKWLGSSQSFSTSGSSINRWPLSTHLYESVVGGNGPEGLVDWNVVVLLGSISWAAWGPTAELSWLGSWPGAGLVLLFGNWQLPVRSGMPAGMFYCSICNLCSVWMRKFQEERTSECLSSLCPSSSPVFPPPVALGDWNLQL